jgi:hypothetical protein
MYPSPPCRAYPFPPTGHRSIDVQRVSPSFFSSIDVQGYPFPPTGILACRVYPFPPFCTSSNDVQDVSLSTKSGKDVQEYGCINLHHQLCGRAWGVTLCIVRAGCIHLKRQCVNIPFHFGRFFKCRNFGLFGIRPIRYLKKCRCRDQFVTGIKIPSPVLDCSGIGMLRYRTEMPQAGFADFGFNADAQLCQIVASAHDSLVGDQLVCHRFC